MNSTFPGYISGTPLSVRIEALTSNLDFPSALCVNHFDIARVASHQSRCCTPIRRRIIGLIVDTWCWCAATRLVCSNAGNVKVIDTQIRRKVQIGGQRLNLDFPSALCVNHFDIARVAAHQSRCCTPIRRRIIGLIVDTWRRSPRFSRPSVAFTSV